MPTKYRGSLGFRLFFSLIVLWLGCPPGAAAQAPDAVVAIDPPQVPVDLQATFSVAVTIADVSELRSYEFKLTYDPAVVEVEAVEQGPLLEGLSPIPLGPAIANDVGTVTFGVLAMGSGPWPSGAGELATIRLRAVGEGATALDLQDVKLFDASLEEMAAAVEDGQVQVGEAAQQPTETPTEEAAASDTPAPTSAAMATETATPPPEATATKTPTGGATSAPEATATESPEETATSPPGATATEAPTGGATTPPARTPTERPTQGALPTATGDATSTAQPGQTPVEGPPSATAELAEGQGETVEPAVTSAGEPTGGETPSGASPWLIVAAALLGLAGVALIGVGIFAFGLKRRPGEEPRDEESEE